jgi:hypothetical protein
LRHAAKGPLFVLIWDKEIETKAHTPADSFSGYFTDTFGYNIPPDFPDTAATQSHHNRLYNIFLKQHSHKSFMKISGVLSFLILLQVIVKHELVISKDFTKQLLEFIAF